MISFILMMIVGNLSVHVIAWCPAKESSTEGVFQRSIPITNAHRQKKSHLDSRKPSRQNIRKKSRDPDALKPPGERTTVILYHKPANVITSHSSNDEAPSYSHERRRTVYEDIYSMNGYVEKHNTHKEISSRDKCFEEITGIKSKLHAIGRLDADTTGLLLLTNDGALVHRITNPTSKDVSKTGIIEKIPVQKTYEATIMGRHILPEDVNENNMTNPLSTLITTGVLLPQKYGGQTKPVDRLSILSHPSRTTTCISVTISEGKNRQIRRMFHAIGSGVMRLHRVSVGDVDLGDLKEGEWRLLSDGEILRAFGYECRPIYTNKPTETRK